MKLSWIVVTGPEDLRKQAIEKLEMIADTYLSVNSPVQWAISSWMDKRLEIQKEILKRVQTNYQHLQKWLEPIRGLEVLPVEGGWYAILKISRMHEDQTWALRLLEKDQVLVHPGYLFNLEEGHLVVSLLPTPQTFQEATERLAARIKQETKA